MKTLFEKLENFNFKKAFVVFFAAFLVYGVVSVSFAIANGGWGAAVN